MYNLKLCFGKFLDTEDKKRLFSNFISLSVLQGANYILPLITLPYLVRVLGPEKFGLIAFAQAFIQYFNILTDYGFNLSATREISIHRENKEKVSEIFSAVMIIKIALFLLSLTIMSIVVFAFEKFRQDSLIFFFAFGLVLGQVLFPVWFFQGMERMKYITILNITSKLIFTIAIFVFIHSVNDYLYVPLISSLGYIVAGVLALWIVFKNFKIKLIFPSKSVILTTLKEGWYIFISTVAISIYTISNTFILGLFTNNTIVGYYSAAEKIIKVVRSLLRSFSQTIYPYISKLASESKERATNFIRKLIFLVGLSNLVLSLTLFVFAKHIVKLLFGNQYSESIIVLKILSFLPLIIGLATIFATFYLLGFGHVRQWSKIIILCSVLHIFFIFVLVGGFKLQHIGVSWAWVLTEICILIFSFLSYRRRVMNANRRFLFFNS